MTYALGICLTADAVTRSILSAEDSQVAEPTPLEPISPVLFLDGERVLVGGEAAAAAEKTPQALVRDVVGQFTVDRIWFAGGQMLTPDSAMNHLLDAVKALTQRQQDGSPAAVTIVCPPHWDGITVNRLEALVATWPQIVCRDGVDSIAAARDAHSRLQPVTQSTGAPVGDMPLQQSSFVRPSAPETPSEAPTPIRTNGDDHRQRRLASGLAVLVIVVLVLLVTLIN